MHNARRRKKPVRRAKAPAERAARRAAAAAAGPPPASVSVHSNSTPEDSAYLTLDTAGTDGMTDSGMLSHNSSSKGDSAGTTPLAKLYMDSWVRKWEGTSGRGGRGRTLC